MNRATIFSAIEGRSVNLSFLFGRFGRIVTHRLLSWGVNKGIDTIAKRSGGTDARGQMTPQARKQAAATREAVKRARKAAQIARRMGR